MNDDKRREVVAEIETPINADRNVPLSAKSLCAEHSPLPWATHPGFHGYVDGGSAFPEFARSRVTQAEHLANCRLIVTAVNACARTIHFAYSAASRSGWFRLPMRTRRSAGRQTAHEALVAACRAVLGHLDGTTGEVDAVAILRAAIAKAEGRP